MGGAGGGSKVPYSRSFTWEWACCVPIAKYRILMRVRLNDEEKKTKKRDGFQMKKRRRRPHIKAAARDATGVSIVRSGRRFVTSLDVNNWLKGRRERQADMRPERQRKIACR